jgi:transposase
MNKRYIVRLSSQERDELNALVKKGKRAAYIIKHSLILLAVDADGPNSTDEEIAKSLRCHKNTVRNVRQRFVEQGLEAALERKKQLAPSRQRVLDGEGEARLIAISRMTPPKGNARWTLKLLADELVAQEVVESISEQTVRRTLKKMSSSRT